MRHLLTLTLCLLATAALAAPYLVCDPSPPTEGVTHYDVTDLDTGVQTRTAAPLHADMATQVAAGQINVEIRAVRVDPVWGDARSDPTPFAQSRPGAPGTPGGIALSAQ